MTTDSLFPDLETPEPPPSLSADARRTARQRAAVAAGVHPLRGTVTRPDLGTCGTCALRTTLYGYPKCTLGGNVERRKAGPYMTHGAATDCRAWWPACPDHVAKDDAS